MHITESLDPGEHGNDPQGASAGLKCLYLRGGSDEELHTFQRLQNKSREKRNVLRRTAGCCFPEFRHFNLCLESCASSMQLLERVPDANESL